MSKKELTIKEKQLDTDLWIIALVTGVVFLCYAVFGKQFTEYVKDSNNPILGRVLLSAGLQYGIAGLGVTVVCILRKESFVSYGLRKKNLLWAVLGTLICYVPFICFKLITGQFDGYRPLSVLVTEDVLNSGLPMAIFGMAVIAVAWGFFEGFNYVVISEKINQRYSSKNVWLDWGAIICAFIGILVHPFSTTLIGIVQILVTFIALYGMLVVKRKTENAWGCVFAFLLIWNAF